MDKKGITNLFREVYEKHPDQYRDIAQKLYEIGHFNAQASGTSLKLKDMLPPPEVEVGLKKLQDLVSRISQSDMPDDEKEKKIVDMVLQASPLIERDIFEYGITNGNSLAMQAKSGSRGNSTQLKQIVAGDMLVEDHRERRIPIPILNGYAKGLTPAEYWAGSYGARKGTVSTKFATQDAGFMGKQLATLAHRLVVSEKDCGAENGMPIDGADPDNVGSVLAMDAGDYKAGTAITPKIARDLKNKKIVVRSPITCQSEHGVCAHCVGIREKGGFPSIGENVGMTAAQAIGEPLAQGMLSAKHSGGAVSDKKKSQSGFDYLNQLIQVPKSFRNGAAIASTEGRVEQITEAPQGGKYVLVAGKPHYVQPGLDVIVKPGDRIDAGDMLSDGTPNPGEIVQHKGIGEGRRQFVHTFKQALSDSGIKTHRRNLELLSRGLINHVKISDLDNNTNYLPDDVAPYDVINRSYRSREDSTQYQPHRAVGKYLERPALHYSIGTKVTPNVAKELETYGVPQVLAHDREPAFQPLMVRSMESGLRDPNWMSRLGGSYLEKGFLDSVHRGRAAPLKDTSYIPSLTGDPKNFGNDLGKTGLY